MAVLVRKILGEDEVIEEVLHWRDSVGIVIWGLSCIEGRKNPEQTLGRSRAMGGRLTSWFEMSWLKIFLERYSPFMISYFLVELIPCL